MSYKSLELVSKVDDENIDKEVMRQSLSSITKELQRFHFYYNSCPRNDLFEIVKQCKERLKFNRKKVKKLQEKIETACIVANTVMSAKKRESNKMKTLVESMENESAQVIQDNMKFKKNIHDLTMENLKISNKLQNLHNWINLGYEKMQNLRNEPVEDLTLFTKFKMIIFYCGQYYADFHNENQRCEQLEQKARFYYNKLRILENDLKNVSDELKSVRYQNMKLQRQNSNTPIVYSAGSGDKTQKSFSEKNMLMLSKQRKEPEQSDLSLHLSIIRKLITDQDTMIQNLNHLSEEMNTYE